MFGKLMDQFTIKLINAAFALVSIAPFFASMRMIGVLRRFREMGRPQASMSGTLRRRWPLAIPFYVLPVVGVTFFIADGLFEPLVAAIQLLVTSMTFSLALTLMLLSFSFELNGKFDKAWVKFLDFPYLFFAMFGLFRLIESTFQARPQSAWSLFSVGALAFAIAIRASKATIETFFDDWTGRRR